MLEFGPIDAPPWPLGTTDTAHRARRLRAVTLTRRKAAAFSSGCQASEGSYEPVEDRRAAYTRQLERERVRAAHLGLELDLVERGRQPFHPGHRRVAKSNTGLVPAHQQTVDAERPANDTEGRGGEEGLCGWRKRPEPVPDFSPNLLDRLGASEGGQAPLLLPPGGPGRG